MKPQVTGEFEDAVQKQALLQGNQPSSSCRASLNTTIKSKKCDYLLLIIFIILVVLVVGIVMIEESLVVENAWIQSADINVERLTEMLKIVKMLEALAVLVFIAVFVLNCIATGIAYLKRIVRILDALVLLLYIVLLAVESLQDDSQI